MEKYVSEFVPQLYHGWLDLERSLWIAFGTKIINTQSLQIGLLHNNEVQIIIFVSQRMRRNRSQWCPCWLLFRSEGEECCWYSCGYSHEDTEFSLEESKVDLPHPPVWVRKELICENVERETWSSHEFNHLSQAVLLRRVRCWGPYCFKNSIWSLERNTT